MGDAPIEHREGVRRITGEKRTAFERLEARQPDRA
jgi:hypothetical protein